VTTVPFQSLGVQMRRPTVRQRHWPFNLPKAAMNMRAVTRLAAIMIKKFVVRISCVSVARYKPWSERIYSIAVYVIASVSKIAHCVCVEGDIVHDLAICHAPRKAHIDGHKVPAWVAYGLQND